MSIVPLLLGAVVATVLSYNAFKDFATGKSLKAVKGLAREIRSVARAPTILVLGFQKHGKSSFINSVFRVMCNEKGPFIRRAETGPHSDLETTSLFRFHRLRDEDRSILFTLVDSPPLAHDLEQKHVESELKDFLQSVNFKLAETSTDKTPHVSPFRSKIVMLVINAADLVEDKLYFPLQTIAQTLRTEGFRFLMVLTNKRSVSSRSMNRVIEEISIMCATESIYCLENYVQPPCSGCPKTVRRKRDTHSTILQIIRQGLEFCR